MLRIKHRTHIQVFRSVSIYINTSMFFYHAFLSYLLLGECEQQQQSGNENMISIFTQVNTIYQFWLDMSWINTKSPPPLVLPESCALLGLEHVLISHCKPDSFSCKQTLARSSLKFKLYHCGTYTNCFVPRAVRWSGWMVEWCCGQWLPQSWLL